MSTKEKMEGEVLMAYPDLRFRVLMDNGKELTCYTSGKMRLNKIRVLIGDRVEVEVDPYGGSDTNRLIKRLPQK